MKKCSLCSGIGQRPTQPYGIVFECEMCVGTGKSLDLGQLMLVKQAKGQYARKLQNILGK